MRVSKWLMGMALAAACGGGSAADEPNGPAAAVEARTGESFRLRPGGIARVGSEGLLVAFRGTVSDSRCAVDVTCVWAGDAVVRINVTIGRMAWTPFELHTTLEPRTAVFRDRRITLVAVEPEPRSDRQIQPQDYVITLRVD